MKDSIADRIRRHGFKRLLLAVSGGLDSICLAHYFIKNREALGIEWLGIAHVHHGLREGTADRDATFVEAFARKYNIPFFLKRLNGEALKNAEGSLEENARDARYKALQEAAENCDAIVTAHHAGDQAETMYMRLRRGTTLAGLKGIQEVRDNIYRPLLNTTRAELLTYARENNLEWCEDESNSDVKFARNKVRHEFLPQLEKESPGAATQLCRIALLADKAYAKVMNAGESLFAPVLKAGNADADLRQHDMWAGIALDKKKLRKVLLAHESTDLSEMFRLWLSEQGFRFPIGFLYSQTEPAHVKIPVRAAYRKRSIVKKGSTVLICEFESVEAALKFVSCK
ncbi:tRNA lysidine(34) synthetase TilS [Fibrobacter sp. UWB5]|uniref:tRNA lysidine(34) synthetase TilS n=1 Tax=Fibrobacter sp. UWB5 TaxID=1964360 RepID=UPI000B52397E|nr:tRNA lysidine(34) synthetase TilS [Fibrobacter sp. UWB5]OWV12694.1 tRNA lysidine(34) synthetase TilS [Fibrobacter sp. UWB5]